MIDKENEILINCWLITQYLPYKCKESLKVIISKNIFITPIKLNLETREFTEDLKKLDLKGDSLENYKYEKYMDDVGMQTFGACNQRELYIFYVNNEIIEIYNKNDSVKDENLFQLIKDKIIEEFNNKLSNDLNLRFNTKKMKI